MKSGKLVLASKGSVVISVLVGLLTLAVAVQGLLIYRMYQKDVSHPSIAAESAERSPSAAPQKLPHAARPPSRSTGSRGNTVVAEDPFDVFRLWDRDADEWDPFQEMERMREQMDRLFQSSINRLRQFGRFTQDKSFAFSPEMDLADDGANYVVRFNLPGVDKSQVSVKLDDRLLTVEAHSADVVEEKKSGRVIRTERRTGHFMRSVVLPGPVRAESMSAQYEDGVLTVIVPKATAGKAEKVITL